MAKDRRGLLCREFLQEQLDQIELLSAMYSGEGELMMDRANLQALDILRNYIAGTKSLPEDWAKDRITMKLQVACSSMPTQSLYINISLPLSSSDEVSLVGHMSLEQPAWLSRKSYRTLENKMPGPSTDLLPEAIEYLRDHGSAMTDHGEIESQTSTVQDGPIVRVWFYFPSLSTREKRDVLVRLAPAYDLTGFVLAGKPGVLCLEGSTEDIQAYVADIKRNSWGDIPSFQKKITERFRENDITDRKFTDMREITEEIDRHGQRGNRGDLSQVEQFLQKAGLAEVFGPIFMQTT